MKYYTDISDTTADRTVTYTYDVNGNITGVNDTAIQAGDLYSFTYDKEDRPDVTTILYTPSAITLNNDYDVYGNRDVFTLNDGTTTTTSFSYNPLNQLETISLAGQAFIPEYYEDAGRLKKLTYPNSITTDYSYEDNGPIKQILTQTGGGTPQVLEDLDYVYDSLLNVDTFTSQRDGGTHDYDYDSLDHLTSADHPTQADETFSYDNVGNRTNTGYGYNDNHQITQSPGVASYTFDADGNMTGKAGGFTYTYNKDNRLTSFTDANDSTNNATYEYDPFGRRISKTVNGTTTYFVWDGSRLIGEYIGSTRIKRYDYLPTSLTPVQIQDQNGTYNAHYDHLQTPTFLTDSTQTIVWNQTQSVFGAFTVNEDPDTNGTPITYNMRFPGQYYDGESGLHYNYLRYYDPNTGRYIRKDPIGVDYNLMSVGSYSYLPFDGVDPRVPAFFSRKFIKNHGPNHLYNYAKQNPANFTDPLGLLFEENTDSNSSLGCRLDCFFSPAGLARDASITGAIEATAKSAGKKFVAGYVSSWVTGWSSVICSQDCRDKYDGNQCPTPKSYNE